MWLHAYKLNSRLLNIMDSNGTESRLIELNLLVQVLASVANEIPDRCNLIQCSQRAATT
jgi:hypothetical protein